MNHTIGKVRTKDRDNQFKIIISNQELYKLSNDTISCVKYSPDHNLDEEDWFEVNEFSKQSYYLSWLSDGFQSTRYETINRNEVDKIDYICTIQDENWYCFQSITPSYILRSRSILVGESVKYK